MGLFNKNIIRNLWAGIVENTDMRRFDIAEEARTIAEQQYDAELEIVTLLPVDVIDYDGDADILVKVWDCSAIRTGRDPITTKDIIPIMGQIAPDFKYEEYNH